MNTLSVRLQILFEDPFWIGLLERRENGTLSVSKVTFGAEPREPEVLAFYIKNWRHLRFSPAVPCPEQEKYQNPKRRSRDARRIQQTGIGTRSQQALQLQREQQKQERKMVSKEEKLREQERQFQLRRQKKKEKHKGH